MYKEYRITFEKLAWNLYNFYISWGEGKETLNSRGRVYHGKGNPEQIKNTAALKLGIFFRKGLDSNAYFEFLNSSKNKFFRDEKSELVRKFKEAKENILKDLI